MSANNHQLLVDAVMGAGLKNGSFTEADKAEYLKAWSQPGALTGGLNYYRAAQVGPPPGAAPATAPAASAAPIGPKITVPTLVIWGEKDTALLTGNLDGLETVVTQLSVRRIADGTHWVVHEHPAVVNKHIRDFLGR